MTSKSKKSGAIPKQWQHCPPNGNRLIVNKFMPFKTPLSEKYDSKVPAEYRYPPEKLFQIAQRNKVKIGLWIDLTNTDRYYHRKNVEKRGCRYVKLNCQGHGQTPSVKRTLEFVSIVHEYIVRFPFDCIAVHCTHGFNRTGFLIASFLVEKLNFDVAAAVETFASARPPGIYKEDYIRELFWRYGKVSDAPMAPVLPAWRHEKTPSGKR